MGDVKYCSQLVLRAPEHTIGLSKKAICICLLASEGVTGLIMCYYVPGAAAAHHQGVFPSQTNEEFEVTPPAFIYLLLSSRNSSGTVVADMDCGATGCFGWMHLCKSRN